MESVPLNLNGSCVSSDEELFANIASALKRGFSELTQPQPVQAMPSIAIVASGPSLAGQTETIRQMKASGIPILAVRGGHDWLIAHDIIPDFALTVDPLPDSWHCFEMKNKAVTYLIASQCHPAVFDHLSDMNVVLWHAYMKKDQAKPANRMLIAGATTSGLRAIFVSYVLGYRDFHLFGLDSCLESGKLRVNGDGLKAGDKPFPVRIEPEGEVFMCNGNMALQAQSFQDCYALLDGARFTGYGRGVIQAIIKKREANADEYERMHQQRIPENHRVSFIHCGGPEMASYRYRGSIPAKEMGASMNDLTASTLVFIKPQAPELLDMARAKHRGQRVIVDFCDDHFTWTHYQEFLKYADLVTCPTPVMAERIRGVPRFGREAIVIPDPYEFPLAAPHFWQFAHREQLRLFWFGHSVNRESIERIKPQLSGERLRIVSNFDGAIPWSLQRMIAEFANADVVLMPATDDYKSANRTVEAIRQGCFVIAEPHPSLNNIPGIWIGNIKEGLEWLKTQPISSINLMVSSAQNYVTDTYSPKTVSLAWKNAIQLLTTSEAGEPSTGTTPDGSTSILETTRI